MKGSTLRRHNKKSISPGVFLCTTDPNDPVEHHWLVVVADFAFHAGPFHAGRKDGLEFRVDKIRTKKNRKKEREYALEYVNLMEKTPVFIRVGDLAGSLSTAFKYGKKIVEEKKYSVFGVGGTNCHQFAEDLISYLLKVKIEDLNFKFNVLKRTSNESGHSIQFQMRKSSGKSFKWDDRKYDHVRDYNRKNSDYENFEKMITSLDPNGKDGVRIKLKKRKSSKSRKKKE